MLNISLGSSHPFDILQVNILCLALSLTFNGGASLESTFLSYFYILDKILLSDVRLVKIFSQFVDFPVVLLTMPFALQKLGNFMRSHFSILDLRVLTIGVLFRKYSPVPMCSRFLPIFFYKF